MWMNMEGCDFMRILKKRMRLFALVIVMMISTISASPVVAAQQEVEAVYDMKRGGTQMFSLHDENGEEVEIEIEEIPGVGRIKDGSYKVSYKKKGSWEAGFYVKVSDNKITNAYAPFSSATIGKITSATLTRNSSLKATYSFVHTYLVISYDTRVIAKISGDNLVISEK